jgi:RNA binding exosome subunit
MKLVNNVNVRVFCRADEYEQIILDGLYKVIGFNSLVLDDEKLVIKKSVVSGFDDKIKIFEFYIDKQRHIKLFLKNLNNNLSDANKKDLLLQYNRLDDNLDFFLRLSKPLIFKDSFILTDSGDCFHIKLNLAVFPTSKVLAKEKLKEIFLFD